MKDVKSNVVKQPNYKRYWSYL